MSFNSIDDENYIYSIGWTLNYNFYNRMETNTSLKDFEILARLG